MNTTKKRTAIEPLEARQLLSDTWASTATPSTSRVIYVSSGSSIKTLSQAVAASGNNTKILFHRGEIFNTGGATETNSNIVFGAYGNGADPVLVGNNRSSSTGSILSLKGSNVRVEGLRFADHDTSTNFTAISTVTSHNVTINHCSAESSLYNFVYAGKYSVGTTISGCWAENGQQAYFVYSALGSKYLDVNHCFTAGSRVEHGIRIHTDNFRIMYNRIIQKPASKYSYKSCLCVRQGSNGYIAYNYFTGGQVTILGPLAAETHATLTNVVYEHNYSDQASQFQLFEGASGIIIRNNTILKVGGTGTVITIMASNASRPGPSGSIQNNYCSGNHLTSGDSSHLSISGNKVV